MDFPKETKELSDKIAQEIRGARGNSPLHQAEGIFSYLKNRFGYGFWEGIEQGYFIRWPHEIQKQWECIEAAVFVYCVAEAMGLNPKMRTVRNWRRLNTGHDAVDVDANGQRILIDPLNEMFGPVSYQRNAITVDDNPLTKRCVLPCKPLDALPRDFVIARIDYYRTDEGMLNLLSAGQSYAISYVHSAFLVYYPKKQVLSFQLREHPPFLTPKYHLEEFELDRLGVVRVTAEQGVYKKAEWERLRGKEILWTLSKNQRTKKENGKKFNPKVLGRNHLLTSLLYETLLRDKFGLTVDEPIPQNYFLLEGNESPLQKLAEKIDIIKKHGITSANKAAYYALRDAYIRLVEMDQGYSATKRLMDFGAMNMWLKAASKKHGTNLDALSRKLLKRFGEDERTIMSMYPREPLPDWDEAKMKIFPYDNIDTLVKRLIQSGAIK